MSLKIVFFGTPRFAAELLVDLLERGVTIAGVVTQPDRARGRNLKESPSAVKEVAVNHRLSVPILQPEKASDPLFLQALEACQGDLYVVAAFGQILPQKLLSIPMLGCINVHASLLPKYRGAAPIQRALMNGDPITGVSIQKMVYRLDAGDVIAEDKMALPIEMTHGELEQRLCDMSKPLLFDVIRQYDEGIPVGQVQSETDATFAPKIQSSETEIRWNRSAREIHNQIRALSPKPGAWCSVLLGSDKKKLKILRTALSDEIAPPGTLLLSSKKCLVAGLNGSLELLEVQPEGKKAMRAADWLRGCQTPPVFIGAS